ncbi:MAG: radical SAM protein [Bacillota bacterium]
MVFHKNSDSDNNDAPSGRDAVCKTPYYLKLSKADREKKIAELYQIFKNCTLCPRECKVNRPAGERGRCGAAADVIVCSVGPHYGEENELVGRGGSGTIFFVNCNLECVFCQNWTISRGVERGEKVSIDQLASLMLSLQNQGCSNVNLVSPTPYLNQIAAAIDRAADSGLKLPIVYNCGGYEKVESLRILEGFIDIYMPDAKYASDAIGARYSGVPDYFTRFSASIKEMQQQVGDLVPGPGSLACRGLLVRHLVMPEGLAESEKMANFLSSEVSANCAVNVMGQYYPAYQADDYPPLDRRITAEEFNVAREAFSRAGLRLL